MNTVEQKNRIKRILKDRLTVAEYALMEAYMNQEIAEFNVAAKERNTLLVEVKSLTGQLENTKQTNIQLQDAHALLTALYTNLKLVHEHAVADAKNRGERLFERAKGRAAIIRVKTLLAELVTKNEKIANLTTLNASLEQDAAHNYKIVRDLYQELSDLYARLAERQS